jgi:acetyl-CoA synthetase
MLAAMASNTERYRAARDQVFAIADDEKLATTFQWPQLVGAFNWATDWFDVIARDPSVADRAALRIVTDDDTEQTVSFAAMARRSDQVAAWLEQLGVGKGDRVVLMLGNQIELWECTLAIAKLGAVVMPATGALGPSDVADRIARGEPRAVVVNAADTAKFTDVDGDYRRVVVGADTVGWHCYADAADVAAAGSFTARTTVSDPMLIYFTSGTTTKPKLVTHSQISYPVGHLTTMAWIGVRPGDVHLAISSPGWAKHAWSCLFAPWIAEATILVYNYRRLDAAALLSHLRRAEVTTFCAPPTLWRMLIQADLGARPEALREIVAAGEPLNPDVITQVERAWGLTIRDGYGQTETTLLVGNLPGRPVKPGSMGRPLPGVPIVLVDPVSGAPGQEGEMCLDLSTHPVNLMTGYLQDPERNAAAMAGGYYHTGDIARRDDEGTITYIGRADDVFKSSGYKVSPFELESVLIEHPAIMEAAVVPQPDDTRLAIPKAYIALAADWPADAETARAIMEFVRDRVAAHLRVRRVEFYDLPKTISGKIRRVDLRRREEGAYVAGTPNSSEYRYEDLVG